MVAAAVAVVALVAGVAAVVLWPDDDDPEPSVAARQRDEPREDEGTTSTSGTVATTASTAPTSTVPPPLSADSPVVIGGMGAIRAGMTVDEASAAGRVELVMPDDYGFPDCYFVEPAGGPKGVSFMVTGGTIGRVDVNARGVRTRSGVGVGSTEGEVQRTYPGQITVSPHTYDPTGHYLTFVPRDPAERELRIVFETDGSTVTSFRAGRLPDVEFVEGCA